MLINALMLGVIGSMMTAYDFDEMQAAMRRWSTVGDVSWSFCWDPKTDAPTANLTDGAQLYCDRVLRTNGYAEGYCIHPAALGTESCSARQSVGFGGDDPISELFNELFHFINAGIFCLAASLLVAFFLYLLVSATSFKDHNGRFSNKMLDTWYFSATIPLILFSCVMMTIVGVVFVCQTLGGFHSIKSPHPGIETQIDRGSSFWSYPTYEHGAVMQIGYMIYLLVACFLCWTLAGIGVCRKARLLRAMQQADLEDIGQVGPGFHVEDGASGTDSSSVETLRAFIVASQVRGQTRADEYARALVGAGVDAELLVKLTDWSYCDAVLDKAGVYDLGDRARIAAHVLGGKHGFGFSESN